MPLALSYAPGALALRLGFFIQAAFVVTSLFDDWKRFCFVLREIASGENGSPLPGFEAQKRAQAVLTACGYTWPGQTVAPAPIAAPDMPSKPENEVKKPARKSERGTR